MKLGMFQKYPLAILLAGAALDAILLTFLLQSGVSLGMAGLLSLTLIGMTVYAPGLRAANRAPDLWFVATLLLTALLRAGILAWMVRIPGCPIPVTALMGASAGGILLWFLAPIAPPAVRSRVSSFTSPEYRITVLLIFAVLLRLVYLGLPELVHEEAYYWNYSRHPALSYLDHPPMVAWLIRGFTTLLGHNELGVRAGAFLSWCVGGGFVYALSRRIYDRSTAICALLLFATLPAYFLFGFAMSPDAPLIACWAATLYFFYRWLIDERPFAWLGAAIFLGLGMLSKYTIALLGFAMLVFMLVDGPARRWLQRPQPWLAVMIALAIFSPVIIWNWQHEWVSFAFQTVRRAGGDFDFSLPSLLGSAALLITPVGLGAVAVSACSRRFLAPSGEFGSSPRFQRGFRLLMLSTLIPLGVFVLISLTRHTKLNWTAPLWIGVLPYLARMMAVGWSTDAGRWRTWLSPATWKWTSLTALLLLAVVMHYFVLGLPGLSYRENSMGLPAIGWPALAQQVESVVDAVERKSGTRPLVVGLNSDRLSSWLAYYRSRAQDQGGSKNATAPAQETAGPNLFDLPRSNMYGLWFPAIDAYRDRPLVLIGDRPRQLDVNPGRRIMGPVQEMTTEKNGQVVWRVFYRILSAEKNDGRGGHA